MFPGLTTKISEIAVSLTNTIHATADLIRVTDTTSTTVLTTLVPHFGGGFSGVCFLQNASGQDITTLTTGNILTAVTIANNALITMVYSKAADKFIVGPLA